MNISTRRRDVLPRFCLQLEAQHLKSICFLAVLLVSGTGVASVRHNGFDVTNATIPIDEIRSGGPPRDGIPAIDDPRFIAPSGAGFMQDDDEVISEALYYSFGLCQASRWHRQALP